MQIRRATGEDAEAIAAVLYEAFVEYEPLYTPEGFARTVLPAERLRDRPSEGPVWVAEQEGRIVGTVSALPRGDGYYVRSMAVVPSARGQQVGAVLLHE